MLKGTNLKKERKGKNLKGNRISNYFRTIWTESQQSMTKLKAIKVYFTSYYLYSVCKPIVKTLKNQKLCHIYTYFLEGSNSGPTSILTIYCPYILEDVRYKNILDTKR